MISKTIGYNGVHYFQIYIYNNNITEMRGSKLLPSTAVTDGVRYWLWVIPPCIYNYNIFFRQCLCISLNLYILHKYRTWTMLDEALTAVTYVNPSSWTELSDRPTDHGFSRTVIQWPLVKPKIILKSLELWRIWEDQPFHAFSYSNHLKQTPSNYFRKTAIDITR